MKKLMVFAAAVIMSGVFTVQAAEQKKDADMTVRTTLATQLLETMQVGKTLNQSFDSIKKMQTQMVMKFVKNAKDQARAIKTQNKMMDLMMKELCWENLKPEFEKLYAETYSAEELNGLLKFYQSALGKKFIEKQPEMQRNTMLMVQQMMMRVMPKVQALTRQLQQEAEAEAAAKTVPESTPASETKTTEATE